MRYFDSIQAKKRLPEPVSRSKETPVARPIKPRKNPPMYYFYRSAQVVLSVWIITVCAIIAGPWLDYYVKGSINRQNGTQVLGDSTPAGSVLANPLAAVGSGTFYLKNDKIEISAPIVEGIGEDSLSKGIGHHPDSAWFGQKGNVVLAGHNTDLNAENPFAKVFFKLRDVSVGDSVVVNWQGKNYYYTVFKSQTILPKDTSLFGKVDDWILTFYTCDPPYTDWKRLVYQAKLEKVE